MSERLSAPNKRPMGVYLLASLLLLVGGIWLVAAIALPLTGVTLVPWYVYLGAAAYFLTLGWGLWRARRWAYFATLLMCVVLAYYLVQTAVVFQRNVLLPFVLLVVIFGYLIQRRVRAAFDVPHRDEGPTNASAPREEPPGRPADDQF